MNLSNIFTKKPIESTLASDHEIDKIIKERDHNRVLAVADKLMQSNDIVRIINSIYRYGTERHGNGYIYNSNSDILLFFGTKEEVITRLKSIPTIEEEKRQKSVTEQILNEFQQHLINELMQYLGDMYIITPSDSKRGVSIQVKFPDGEHYFDIIFNSEKLLILDGFRLYEFNHSIADPNAINILIDLIVSNTDLLWEASKVMANIKAIRKNPLMDTFIDLYRNGRRSMKNGVEDVD